MSTPTLESYDWMPYERDPITGSHPDRLATVARLRGMKPADVGQCRVLELGCAMGANLIPMAVTLPGSQFVGVDLSRRQIDEAKQFVARLGLGNLEFRHASILDLTRADGPFDYIIAHGVYSWVPPDVQEKILDICATNLTPHGVAYISYNTYPGWNALASIREMMLLHAGDGDLAGQLKRARQVLDSLADCFAQDDRPYGKLLSDELKLLQCMSETYLLHEYLEECNTPLYFHQFMRRAAAHGLGYLGEAHVAAMWAENFDPKIQERLRQMAGDLIELEQFMDVLRNRPFRQTLLCRQDVELTSALSPQVVRECHVASSLKPVALQPDVAGPKEEAFRSPDGLVLSVGSSFLKAALRVLADLWPLSISFQALCARARGFAGSGDDNDERRLAAHLLECMLRNAAELHVQPSAFTCTVSATPRGSPWARLQAERSPRVADLRHETVELAEMERLVLLLVDGKRDRGQLLDVLRGLHQKGTVKLAGDLDPENTLAMLLDRALDTLARNALLAC